MERLGIVLHQLVSSEAISVAEADRVWEAAWGDLREVEMDSQDISTRLLRMRVGGTPGESLG